MTARPLSLVLIASLALAGCASAPFKQVSTAAQSAPAPREMTQAPETGREVLWGGQIVMVRNQPESTEIEVLSFPLDKIQFPLSASPDGGRFIARFPGYVDPARYPTGRMVSLTGSLSATREGRIGEAPYVWPVVDVAEAYVWPAEGPRRNPPISFGVGVGIWK